MTKTTCIRNAAWVAAWDADARRHVCVRDVDLAFEGDIIVFLGPDFEGEADETIEGRALFVMPGLVDIHSHPTQEPVFRGIREEHGVPEMYDTGLYERGVAFRMNEEARKAAAEVAYSEMLGSGVTSVCDLSAPCEGWINLVAKSGLRGFLAPGYASARLRLENKHELEFAWDEAAGWSSFDARSS